MGGGMGLMGPADAVRGWMDEAKNWNYTDPNHQIAPRMSASAGVCSEALR